MSHIFPTPAILLLMATAFVIFGVTMVGIRASFKRTLHINQTGVLQISAFMFAGWLLLLSMLANRDFFSDFKAMPPRILWAEGFALLVAMVLPALKQVKEVLDECPPAWFIVPQLYRIGVAAVLWLLYQRHHSPMEMTPAGLNWDLIIALSAPLVAWLCYGGGRQMHRLALIWNAIGLGMLLFAILLGILSLPQIGVFTSYDNFSMYFPFVWLPAFILPWGVFLHLFSIRQLLRRIRSNG